MENPHTPPPPGTEEMTEDVQPVYSTEVQALAEGMEPTVPVDLLAAVLKDLDYILVPQKEFRAFLRQGKKFDRPVKRLKKMKRVDQEP